MRVSGWPGANFGAGCGHDGQRTLWEPPANQRENVAANQRMASMLGRQSMEPRNMRSVAGCGASRAGQNIPDRRRWARLQFGNAVKRLHGPRIGARRRPQSVSRLGTRALRNAACVHTGLKVDLDEGVRACSACRFQMMDSTLCWNRIRRAGVRNVWRPRKENRRRSRRTSPVPVRFSTCRLSASERYRSTASGSFEKWLSQVCNRNAG